MECGSSMAARETNMIASRHRGLLLSASDVQLYKVCDDLTEGLVYLMILFSVWAYGTTQTWSSWVMNVGGYVLGLLLAVKLFIRHVKGYSVPQWGGDAQSESGKSAERNRTKRFFTAMELNIALATLTALILGYCLCSAINAAATYESEAITFVYRDHYQKWLPHSFDSSRTWTAFWNYLAIACSFWAVKDWLPGKAGAEERAARQKSTAATESAPLFPARMRRLLWV